MNGLVIGRCPKTSEQLATFCSSVRIVLDNSFSRTRKLPDLEQFEIIYSKGNIRTAAGIYGRTREIRKWIREYDLDLIFTNTKWDMVAAKLATIGLKKKVKLISTSHNSYAWSNSKNVFLMSRLIMFTTDIYVALASFVKDQLIAQGFNPSKIVVVPNTVGYETWEVKQDYSIDKTIKIMYVAAVYPGKRQDFILEVINKLKDQYDIEVDCYGDNDVFPNYVKSMQDKAKEYGLSEKFRIPGRIENADLRHVLKHYDIYFSPSFMEMSPVNILEAQAAGLPVLSSNVGGVADMITHDETGVLYKVDDLQDAVNQLTRLLNDKELRCKVGAGGRKHVSEVYTKVEAGLLIKNAINQ